MKSDSNMQEWKRMEIKTQTQFCSIKCTRCFIGVDLFQTHCSIRRILFLSQHPHFSQMNTVNE